MINTPEFVPGVKDLFTPEAMTKLNRDRSLCERVHALQMREKDLSDLLDGKDVSGMHLAFRKRIAQMAGKADAEETPYALGDPAAFAQSIYTLPRLPSTARMRRGARETARV